MSTKSRLDDMRQEIKAARIDADLALRAVRTSRDNYSDALLQRREGYANGFKDGITKAGRVFSNEDHLAAARDFLDETEIKYTATDIINIATYIKGSN